MKKIIFSILALSLIALCFSGNLNAQSSQQDLDQVESTKQFIGKWIAEMGEDTTMVWEVHPSGNGYEHKLTWQAKGETYFTAKGIIGFAQQRQTVNMYLLWPEGTILRGLGKFVSDKKFIMERFNVDHSHVYASDEMNFITPDKVKYIYKWRGDSETWDDAVVTEATYIRLKK
jgi:hypothetical protein